MSRRCTRNLFTYTYSTYHLPPPRLCTCLASPQLARLAGELERGARLHACVHGAPPTAPTPSEPPTEPTPTAPTPTEPPSSRDEGEALREDSVSQSKGEL